MPVTHWVLQCLTSTIKRQHQKTVIYATPPDLTSWN